METGSLTPGARSIFVPRVLGAVAVLSAALSTAGFTLLVSPAQSTPEYMSQFNAKYDTRGAKLDSCLTCHTSQSGGAANMNPYGVDFGKSHDFAAIEGLDSDGDGFSNIDEIKADTFPGDKDDNPNAKPAPSTTTTSSSTTTTTTGPLGAILGLLPKG